MSLSEKIFSANIKWYYMRFIPVKTRPIMPPKDNIYPVLDKYLPSLNEGDIVIITSKILGIHQGRCVKINKDTRDEKDALVMKEADYYIPRKYVPHEYSLTIKDNTLVAAAGIDRSNGNGYYILWPKNTNKLLQEMCGYLKKKYCLKKLALIAIDSHSLPLRHGTTGVAMGFFGLKPLKDYRGAPDIFGRKLKVSRANIVDSLASISNLLMGESNETTPLLIIRGARFIEFSDVQTYRQLIMNNKQDFFYPLLKTFHKGKRKN